MLKVSEVLSEFEYNIRHSLFLFALRNYGNIIHLLITAPADFVSITDMVVTFEPSETQREVQVAVVDDSIEESDEDFMGVLSLIDGSRGVALGSVATATATILNDDGMINQ